ncbi:hypothetical protein LAV_00132 [Sphingobium phage Lacusarx]|uniref:Uncharacterized protein n=1 Tax=Sphingobium phage Lacusarx TaxID=1980139 RepID=A0A1W6DWW4_9CAUD|nr:hypothetical protein FDH44_gp171 [Sphingobium phage Lacusarx]ARK07507.1 hypothetical protein LAV_00132 [Sphingobium phage Lacusarx]
MRRRIKIAAWTAFLTAAVFAVNIPVHAAPDRPGHQRYDPAAERRAERRWERRRDEHERRERMKDMDAKGAFNSDGTRRRWYDFDDPD